MAPRITSTAATTIPSTASCCRSSMPISSSDPVPCNHRKMSQHALQWSLAESASLLPHLTSVPCIQAGYSEAVCLPNDPELTKHALQ